MTMIQINNAILHVFDQHSGVTVYSKEGLDCTQKDVAEYLTKHIVLLFPLSCGDFAYLLPLSENGQCLFPPSHKTPPVF